MKLVRHGVIHPLLKLSMVMMSSFLAFFLSFPPFFLFASLKRMETHIIQTGLLRIILILLLDLQNNITTLGIPFRIHNIKAAIRRRTGDEPFAACVSGGLMMRLLRWFVFRILLLLLGIICPLSCRRIFNALYKLLDRLNLYLLSLDDLRLLHDFLFLDHHLLGIGLLILAVTPRDILLHILSLQLILLKHILLLPNRLLHLGHGALNLAHLLLLFRGRLRHRGYPFLAASINYWRIIICFDICFIYFFDRGLAFQHIKLKH